MKLIYKNISKDSSGQVTLCPEDGEDLWHTYNLLQPGDSLRSTTLRKVQVESSTGSVGNNRVRTTLTIQIETIDFDSQACSLHVKGRNIQENRYVKMGAYHTLDLEPNRKFTLAKQHWDTIHLERINTACDPTQNADVGAVVMQEGLAHVCLVLSSMTLVRAKIEMQIPRKRRGNSQHHDKGVEKFFDAVMQAVTRHINFEVIKCVLIASPGFVKDQFFDFLFSQALKQENKVLLENKSKFLCIHSSSGYKHSLNEILMSPSVSARLADTKAAGEVKVLQDFYKILQNEPDKACYGIKQIELADEADSIDVLMVTDGLLRSHDIPLRKKLVKIVDSVKDSGGIVRIFSSMHISGEQLGRLTGIAAILRFPVPGMSDCESSSDDNS